MSGYNSDGAHRRGPEITRIAAYSDGRGSSELDKAYLEEGHGMRGDKHFGSPRQLSLLDADARDWIDRHADEGLCLHKFRENMTVRDLSALRPVTGMRLQAGGAELTVTEVCKECYASCPFLADDGDCPLSSGAVFARVDESGEVRPGDPVFIISHLL